MAGNYMDAPSDRIAWDRDGSVLAFIQQDGSVVAQSAATRRALNAESDTPTVLSNNVVRVAVVFPLPMDCYAVFIASQSATPLVYVETSKDTTNGLDGTWSSQSLTNLNTNKSVKPAYRVRAQLHDLQPNSLSTGLRGVRFSTHSSSFSTLRAFHIYGVPSATATTDRLALWHPTDDIKLPTTWFDWGNTPRSSSADRQFRIKNLSADLVATDIDIYIEALTPGTPSVSAMHTLSTDGVNFAVAAGLASLNPGAISPVLTLRRVVPADALVSTWSARLAADVNLWEEYTP